MNRTQSESFWGNDLWLFLILALIFPGCGPTKKPNQDLESAKSLIEQIEIG